jgi:nitrogen fixation protein FixH
MNPDSNALRRSQPKLTGRRVLAMLVGFFGVVMVVNFAMMKAAISTFGGVDTQSSYEAGLAFEGEAARAQAQRQRDWQVSEHLAPDGLAQTLTVVIADGAGRQVSGMDVTARLAHPVDERRDQTVALVEATPGTYRARAEIPSGVWHLDIAVEKRGEQMFRSQNRIIVP